MTIPSLADVAAGFLMQVTEDPQADVGAISKLLFEAANDAASQAGVQDFAALAKRRSVVEVCTSQVVSRQACDDAVAKQEWDSVGAYACVHLMTLNLVDGLRNAEAAKTTADLAAWLYSQEYALRHVTDAGSEFILMAKHRIASNLTENVAAVAASAVGSNLSVTYFLFGPETEEDEDSREQFVGELLADFPELFEDSSDAEIVSGDALSGRDDLVFRRI